MKYSLIFTFLFFYAQLWAQREVSVGVSYSYALSDFSFIDFEDITLDSETNLDSKNPLKPFENLLKNKSDSLKLGQAVSFTWKTYGELIVLKYWDLAGNKLEATLLSSTKGELSINDDPDLKNIIYATQHLKSDVFWEFYNRKESKMPIIQKYRPQVRDQRGILNLDKLGEVMQNNQSEIRSFCDF